MTRRLKIHLDTDLGGDIDDLCALAMLLNWPDLELTGITVVGDTLGRRTGYVRRVLQLVGREDIPVAAGAETSGGFYPYDLGLPDETRYWGGPVLPSPNPLQDALDLLKRSLTQGATLIAIGPYTNLALLETVPRILQTSPCSCGGCMHPPARFSWWGNEMDFNIPGRRPFQCADEFSPTLIPLCYRRNRPARSHRPCAKRLSAATMPGGLSPRYIGREVSRHAGFHDIINFSTTLGVCRRLGGRKHWIRTKPPHHEENCSPIIIHPAVLSVQCGLTSALQ
jgi:hypothetical protein